MKGMRVVYFHGWHGERSTLIGNSVVWCVGSRMNEWMDEILLNLDRKFSKNGSAGDGSGGFGGGTVMEEAMVVE